MPGGSGHGYDFSRWVASATHWRKCTSWRSLILRRCAPVGAPPTHTPWHTNSPSAATRQDHTRAGVYFPTAQAHHPASVVTRRVSTDPPSLRSSGGLRPPTPPGTPTHRPRPPARAALGPGPARVGVYCPPVGVDGEGRRPSRVSALLACLVVSGR